MEKTTGEPTARDRAESDLTLMLMFLSSWREKGAELRRCWKGYSFHVLDALEENDLIHSSRGAKSAYLTPAGEEAARALLRKHGMLAAGE